MNLKEKCSVSYCENKQTGSKGFCSKHYVQMHRNGRITDRLSKECIIEGCSKKRVAHGYCHRHIQQIRKHGKVRGNPYRTMLDPNEFIILEKEKIVEIKFCDQQGWDLKEKALIDLEDFDRVKEHKWYLNNFGYVRTKHKISIALHHFVLDILPKKGRYVDHANMNKLDNRKCNLRFCTKGENSANCKLRKDNKTGYKGIFKYSRNKWKTRIGGKHIGVFVSPEEAAMAYDQAILQKYRGFAQINFGKGGDSHQSAN